ncbi:MAG: Unknown protein [uncultured Campylobacterales bacterium]|uniref:FMN-binding domain-containing protein n=1 Tax=uncultured Campylobacterales bacterium TaxID=352960 RepID=A0A6S6TKK3_9BACT|nr:MAG: Unknown protein [uncultured Campylobacterales bacterium]
MNKILILLSLIASLNGAILEDAMKSMKDFYGIKEVEKKTIFLTKTQKKDLKSKLKNFNIKSIYYYLIAMDSNEQNRYGILLSSKVKSKSVVSLYLLNSDGKLDDIEIIAFNEPSEYKPKEDWLLGFSQKNKMPNITGATLSARAITKQVVLSQKLFDIIPK